MTITDISIARAERNLEERYQSMIESEDAKQDRINELERFVRDELEFRMLAAMAMGEGEVPHAVYRHNSPSHEGSGLYMEQVIDILDYPEVRSILGRILSESTCPIVKELRLAIAKRYAENNAADLAAVRAAE